MVYLFILESIGTSELVLIGIIALIVFGPRKLPEIARTIAKTMAEFRRSTDDFKKTWEQEIAFEDDKKNPEIISELNKQTAKNNEETISRNLIANKIGLIEPEIKEIKKEDFDKTLIAATEPEKQIIADKESGKRDWL
jgi:Tat protein translocase TatB subunit